MPRRHRRSLVPIRRSQDRLAITADQFAARLDEDLWRPDTPGGDERFDASRFGEWLDALADADLTAAAAQLAALDPELVTLGLAAHIAVFDRAALPPQSEPENEPGLFFGETHRRIRTAAVPVFDEIGGYVVRARHTHMWDAIVAVLLELEERHRERFDAIMRGCRRLSNAGYEADGLDHLAGDRAQARFDLSIEREERRERQGYVSPAAARAFLQASRGGSVDAAAEPAQRLPTLARTAVDDHEREVIYLANVLMAGCSVQDRPFTPPEALEAVTAVCRLGLEHWSADPARCRPAVAFQTGWRVLHHDVAMFAAGQLLQIVRDLRCHDRDVQFDLLVLARELTRQLKAGAPWLARGALDVIALLDVPSWAALAALIAEFPVLLANVAPASAASARTIDPSAYELIATGAHVARVHAFMESLPELLIA